MVFILIPAKTLYDLSILPSLKPLTVHKRDRPVDHVEPEDQEWDNGAADVRGDQGGDVAAAAAAGAAGAAGRGVI